MDKLFAHADFLTCSDDTLELESVCFCQDFYGVFDGFVCEVLDLHFAGGTFR